jgi:hypothetical protein
MIYQNFDLEIIASRGDPRLHARVLESPQGDSPFIDVTWPFEAEEENAFLSEIYGGLRQRRVRAAKAATIEEFGGRLFDAVFTGDIEHLFRSSLDVAYRNGKGLRIRLRLPDDSELHSRPWEFLFDTERREFLAVKEHTPLVRYLPVAQPIAPIAVDGPVRILVALAAPTDHPRLDVAREWEILSNALEIPVASGKVKLDRVPGRCTFDNLRDALRHFGAHVFHFIGHGMPGALVLEQEAGKGLEMEATQLRAAFPSGMLPRLIVLNSCSGAIGEDAPFSGLAQGFLRKGVPAVVAMRASITDDAALIFTRYFYRDLIETGIVDASLTEARLRMQGNGHPIEWGTPVLYMRALNGQLFQPGAYEGKRRPPRDSATTPQSGSAIDKRPSPTRPPHTVSNRDQPKQPPPKGAASPGGTKPTWGQEREPEPDPARDKTMPGPDAAAKNPAPPPRTGPGSGDRMGPVDVPPEPPPVTPPHPDRPYGADEPVEDGRPFPYVPVAGALLLLVLAAGAYLAFRDSPAPLPAQALVKAPSPAAPKPDGIGRGDEAFVKNLGAGNPPEAPGEAPLPGESESNKHKRDKRTEERKPLPRAAADGCSNPDIAERPIDCVLRK